MKDKLRLIAINLMMLQRRIEKIEPSEEINYEVEQKVNEIIKKISEVEVLVEEIEAIEEL